MKFIKSGNVKNIVSFFCATFGQIARMDGQRRPGSVLEKEMSQKVPGEGALQVRNQEEGSPEGEERSS